MNYLWLDAETTGTNPVYNDIIQMACVPLIKNKYHDTFNEFCQPVNWGNIQAEATKVHGITEEMMRGFQSSADGLDKFIKYLDSFGVKFTISGFNVSFDQRMMSGWFAKHDRASDFARLFEVNIHDTMLRWRKLLKKLGSAAPQLADGKLETIAKHYGITINAHEALSDILATIELDKIISDLLGEDAYEYEPEVEASEIAVSQEFQPLPQLHIHSQYSLGMAVPKPKDWLKWCKETKTPGFSCVDHGSGISLYDAVRISKDGVTCVPGLGMYFKFREDSAVISMMNAWATSNEGYFNLLKLASLGFTRTQEINGVDTPVLTLEEIIRHQSGLMFGVGGRESVFAKFLLENNTIGAEELFKDLQAKLGEKLHVELVPVDIVRIFESKVGFSKLKRTDAIPEANLGKALNNFMFDMASKYGVKVIPATEAFFIGKDDKILQDTLMKNRHSDNEYFFENYHIKDGSQVYKELKVHLGDKLNEETFVSWIQNAQAVVDAAKSIKVDFTYHMPHVDIPEHIKAKTDDYNKQTYYYLYELCQKHGRWNNDPVYLARFKQEIDVIMNNSAMNFIPYFLLYEDLGREARARGFLQNIARGSAGGSLVSYYLKVIHVDPIKADLPFERFLSHARIRAGSWPDIDMDISRSARPFIMKYLKEKYGAGFAQIATLSTMKTKNAIKDTMMALYGRNRNDPEIKAVCDTIPDSPQGVSEEDFLYGYEDKEGNYHQGHLETNEQLVAFFEQYPDVANIVRRLIGIVRGWSRHASAFIISTLDLAGTRCPTMQMHDKHMGEDILVAQYDAKMVEGSGLVKADILGLKTLDMVTDCVKLIKDRGYNDFLEEDDVGVQFLYRLPEEGDVYADFFNKATDSSFQFNTSLIKGYIQEFCPTKRQHLKDMTALCRPGALDAEWEPGVSAAQYYLDVRNNKRQLNFVHPDLKSILGETNGVFVYQEQVMKFLVDFGGHTLEESDEIRGAIAKKKLDIMQRAFGRVREKTLERGWTLEQTQKVCSQIEAFARYSFNLSHSHAYAELGYITMYLKHYFPLEWWSAVLNNEDEEDKVRHYISILGDIVTPPSMKYPSDKFAIKGDKITAPVSVVKSVGPKAVEELTEKGPFADLADYIKRVNHTKCNIGAVGQLIKARAADDFFDPELPYHRARLQFMEDFQKMKKSTSSFKEELEAVDPLSIFLMERDTNTVFNKSLLEDKFLTRMILDKWKSLKPTGKKNMPYQTKGGLVVLSNLRVAQALLRRGVDEKQKFAFILMFAGSETKKGISKKSGKEYAMLKVHLTDGYNQTEAILWDKTHALRYPLNSVLYIEGTLKEGWKTPVSINADQIEIIF